MLGRILGTILSWAGAALCGLGVWKIIEMIVSGAGSGNWLMVIAGGILAYLFGFLLALGAGVLFIVGLAILFD